MKPEQDEEGSWTFSSQKGKPLRDRDRERESTTEKEIRRASPITVPCKEAIVDCEIIFHMRIVTNFSIISSIHVLASF